MRAGEFQNTSGRVGDRWDRNNDGSQRNQMSTEGSKTKTDKQIDTQVNSAQSKWDNTTADNSNVSTTKTTATNIGGSSASNSKWDGSHKNEENTADAGKTSESKWDTFKSTDAKDDKSKQKK